MQTTPLDTSILAVLHPTQKLSLSWKQFKNSVRYQGSYQLNLRRPTKYPETSRKYIFGDPVHLIDWKAYSRTDQLLIRERQDEASINVAIIIDASPTMSWPDAELKKKLARDLPSKLEIAMRCALNIAYNHVARGDQVEVWLSTGESTAGPTLFFKTRSTADLESRFVIVEKSGFSLSEVTAQFLTTERDGPSNKDICYVLSDGFGAEKTLDLLASGKKKVFFQVLSSCERSISWVENAGCYFDEAWNKKEYQGSDLLRPRGYDQAFADWLGTVEKKVVTELDGSYGLLSDDMKINDFHSLLVHTSPVFLG
jgi:hypothetical protein